MEERFAEIRDHFLAALECDGLDAQLEYAAENCSDDADLRAKLEDMLRAHHQPGSFLASRAEGSPTLDQPITEKPGTQIGPYKLLQQLGEGGMGVVYMAEQKEPVRRRVALKIIKPGMDTRQVIARFKAERQALAMMDHPNIAKVLDAGTTDSGRPYFVMELVKGIPITIYCDQQRLTPKDRLQLFIPVCQAVQHAHQKGIIHRDIKPSNILVALYDGQPVPKIIDFGVAKATSQTLTEKTMFTQVGQVVGTLEYMSPEQAQVNQLDVDTRSDIYSLGVVLYELLTGETPFDRERLRSAAFDEMLRIIREEEPSKPSTKVSSSQSLPSIAANRRIEPGKLGSMIRGELDWIVLKAMEKDRGRRYETASKFGEDIERHLNNEPVMACPPTTAYRLSKFAKRNQAAFMTLSAIALSLLVGTGLASWQAALATQQRNRAQAAEKTAQLEALRANREASTAEAVNDFLQKDLLGFADEKSLFAQGVLPEPDIRMRTVLDRSAAKIDGKFTDQPIIESQVRRAMGNSYLSLGQAAIAETQYRRAWELSEKAWGSNHVETAISMSRVAAACFQQRRYGEAVKLLQEAIDIRESQEGRDHPDVLGMKYGLAAAFVELDRCNEAETLLGQVFDVELAKYGARHADTLTTQVGLAICYRQQGRKEEAAALLRQVYRIQRDQFGDEHPDTVLTMFNLAAVCCDLEEYEEAEKMGREVLEFHRRHRSEGHPERVASTKNLAVILLKKGNYDEAIKLFLVVLDRRGSGEIADAEIQTASKGLVAAHVQRGYKLLQQGHPEEAASDFRDALALDANLSVAHNGMAAALAAKGELEQAVAHFQTVVRLDPENATAYFNLGLAQLKQGRPGDAITSFRECMRLNPQSAVGPWHLGCALVKTGDKAKAMAQFREAVKLEPQNSTVLSDIAWQIATDHDLSAKHAEEAVDYARAAVKLSPHSAGLWSNLGVACYRAGDWTKAVAAFEEAEKLLEHDDLAHRMFFAMACWRLGDHERAKGLYGQGAKWIAETCPRDAEQRRFQEEAVRLLGLSSQETDAEAENSSALQSGKERRQQLENNHTRKRNGPPDFSERPRPTAEVLTAAQPST